MFPESTTFGREPLYEISFLLWAVSGALTARAWVDKPQLGRVHPALSWQLRSVVPTCHPLILQGAAPFCCVQGR